MLFSVVIPTYNRLPLLRQTLATVLAQRFGDFELIVVDDGSTDGTAAHVESMGARARLMRQPNQGPGAARNLGLAAARGDYVMFLDSDDLWFPWTLEHFARAIGENGRPAIVTAAVREFRDEGELAGIADGPRREERFGDFLASSSRPFAVGSCTTTIRRDLLVPTGGFATRRMNAEDHDLVLRLGTAPGFVWIERPALVAWRRHAAAASMDLGQLVAGCEHLIAQENAGAYPGGAARARERREIIGRHVRPVSLESVRQGDVASGWSLYSRTLGWHLGLARWRYLAGFPAHAAGRALRGGGRPVARGR